LVRRWIELGKQRWTHCEPAEVEEPTDEPLGENEIDASKKRRALKRKKWVEHIANRLTGMFSN
jgi:hypothetical protein